MSSDSRSRAMKGWLAGCGAASGVISTFIVVLQAIASGGNLMLFMGGSLAVLFPALLVFVVTCLLTAIPAAFVFWLSEKFAIRSILFFACAGAVTGALSQAVLLGAMFRRGPPQVNWLFVVAGFVAGVVYWRIAGRHAGRDREAPGLSA
jgi:branched-subunit amino acid transport protein